MLPGFGFLQDGLRFGDALRFDGVCLRQAHSLDFGRFRAPLGFDRRGASHSFLLQFFLLRFRQGNLRGLFAFGLEDGRLLGSLGAQNGGLAVGFGGLNHRGFQLFLLALNFLLLDGDLFLRAHSLHAHFFHDDLLPGFGLRQRPGLSGHGLLRFDLGEELGLLDVELALRSSNIRIRIEFRFFAFLHGHRGFDL